MSLVQIVNIIILKPVARFLDDISIELTFDVMQPLKGALEWRFIYFGSPCEQDRDQVLDEVEIENCDQGIQRFEVKVKLNIIVQLEAPDYAKIPPEDLIGCTAFVISGVYNGREFLRCGYYVSVNYADVDLQNDPPEKVDIGMLQRTILSDKPRIFKIPIDWGVMGYGYEFPTEEEQKYAEEDYNNEIRKHLIKELTTNELDENSHVLSNFDAPYKEGGLKDSGFN